MAVVGAAVVVAAKISMDKYSNSSDLDKIVLSFCQTDEILVRCMSQS